MLRSLAWLFLLATLVSCSSRGAGAIMQAARALELGRDQEAYRLLVEWALPSLPAGEKNEGARAQEGKALTLFARACLRTMRTTKGVEAAARAVELSPQDPEAHLVKALLDQRRFRNVAAVAGAGEAVRMNPKEPRYHLALGELHLGGGMVGTPNFALAEAELRESIRLQPDNPRARLALGKTLVLAGKTDEGEAVLDSLLVKERPSADAHLYRGLARKRRRDFAGAAEDFKRATVLDPTNSTAWFNASVVFEREGKADEASAARRKFEEIQAVENAIHQMEVAYHSNSENLDAGLELANLLLRGGRTREGLVLLETLADDHSSDPNPWMLLSEASLAAGFPARAKDSAQHALDQAPEHPRALVALSNAEAALELTDEALAHARRAVEAAPKSAPARIALGNRLLESDDAAGALREFQAVRQLQPENAEILGKIGIALTRAASWQEADRALSAALSRQSNSSWLVHRGMARAQLGSMAWATDDFRAALDANPGEIRAYEELVRALESMNRKSEADSVARRGREMAKVEGEVGKLRAALAEEPGNEKRARHLAGLLEKSGRPEEAARALAQPNPGIDL
jgi:tetratricopeptide (TPR) repeat protein